MFILEEVSKYRGSIKIHGKWNGSGDTTGTGFSYTDIIIVKGHLTGWAYRIKTLSMRDTFQTWLDMLIQHSN